MRAPQWLYLTFTPLQAEELYELAARRFLSPHKLGQGTENLIRPLSLARANDYSEFCATTFTFIVPISPRLPIAGVGVEPTISAL